MDPKFTELSNVLRASMAADFSTRNSAEEQLKLYKQDSQYPVFLLNYVAQAQADTSLKQMAAVNFKNYVKVHWAPKEGSEDFALADEGVKTMIRQNLFPFAMENSILISKQLIEAISIIAETDFPTLWQQLLYQISETMKEGYVNPDKVSSVLATCNRLFKPWQYSFRSEELWMTIKVVVEELYPSFAVLCNTILQQFQMGADIEKHMSVMKKAINLYIYFNSQDIPQNFDDDLQNWMTMFLNILNMQMPGDFEEDLYKVKASVLKCLTLMANKYDEDFEPYIEDFCKTVWELLAYTSGKYQYQKFISASLDYFRAVTLKPKISPLIEQNLTTLFTNLLMPNMILTDIEEELVNQSPADFVRMFLEDANDETQRNAATQLMKVLIKQFPVQVEGILSTM